MRLQDYVRKQVRTIDRTATADEAFAQMREYRVHHLLVMDRKRLVGIISQSDLGGPRGSAVRRNRTVDDLMTEDPFTVPLDTTVKDAANLMRGRFIGCLPVMDSRKVVGVITIWDLLEILGREGISVPGARAKTKWKPVRRISREPHAPLPH